MIGYFTENLANKKILVTGHTGFKGSWMCMILNTLGANVYGFALDPPTSPSLYETANVELGIKSYIGNIQDLDLFKKVIKEIKPHAIIHMAAQALVRESYTNPVETYATNVLGTVNLFEAIRHEKSIRAVLNITTDKCYKNNEWEWGYRETDELDGYDPYSNSKSCSELVTSSFRNSFFNPKQYNDHGVAIATARAGNVIGGGDWAKDRLIPDFIRAITNNEQIALRNPKAIRPWQHVFAPLTGYIKLLIKLLNNGPEYAEAWNFGPGEEDIKDVKWIISTICKFWGDNSSFIIDKNVHPHETQYLKLDSSKARTRLNWTSNWDIETSLSYIVDWHKAYNNGFNMREFSDKQIENYLLKL